MTPEEAVVGACIRDPEVIREAVAIVMPSDFDSWQMEQTFQAVINLHSTGRPVDALTVTEELLKMKSKVPMGLAHQLAGEVPSSSNVSFYAEIVREAATRRQLTRAAHKLLQSAANPEELPAHVLTRAMEDLKRARDDSASAPFQGGVLSDSMAKQDSYDWVIKDLFERGDRYMLTGGEGLGKSMLIRQISLFAAAGIHPFWLYEIPPVNVIVIDRENSERQWRRNSRKLYDAAERVGKGNVGDLYIENNLGSFDITRDKDLGYIHKVLDNFPCDMLCIGPLYKLVPRAIQTDDEAAPLLAALDTLRARGLVLITEAHAGNERTSSLRPVGSSAFLRWPEFGHGIRKDPMVPGRVKIEKWRGDREDRIFPGALNRMGHLGNVPWVAEGASPARLALLNDTAAMIGRDGNGF